MIPTPKILFGFRSFLGTILLSGFLASLGSTMAQQGDSLPQTTSDRAINLKALALQATPLEKEELLVELEAWQELLKAEAKAIAALEIQELSVTPDGKKAVDLVDEKKKEEKVAAKSPAKPGIGGLMGGYGSDSEESGSEDSDDGKLPLPDLSGAEH